MLVVIEMFKLICKCWIIDIFLCCGEQTDLAN